MNAPVTDFIPSPEHAAALNGVTALPQLGVISASGEQAAQFLQGQLTQDVILMPPGPARLAGFCSPKGRLLASFVVCKRSPNDFWLVCSQDLLARTLKRLSMFMLRAKLTLRDASSDLTVYGVLGDTIETIASGAYSISTNSQNNPGFLAPLPSADGIARALWVAAADHPPPAGPAVTPALWDFAAVRSGVASVSAPVVEAFVPQMLNYESVDGISFKKGCYPGQEVVARSQFRGAIKRRAFVGQVSGPAQAGQEVFSAAAPGQPVGLIAQAAAVPDFLPGGGTAVIAALQLAVAQATDLHVGTHDGPALGALRMPYPLAEDI
ncbi:YgfZ/GcvT domain-containing protein [Ottowia sp.]|uniref:CAF17-like 4Fe-4S cluster assembly/insertion protein YgfZ n=1 Tax=Ottowia sp. TaxID=1898956 RepID=UPI003A8531CC